MKNNEVVGVLSLVGLVAVTTYISVMAYLAIQKRHEQQELDNELDLRRQEKEAEKASKIVTDQSDEEDVNDEDVDMPEDMYQEDEEPYKGMDELRYDKNSKEAWDQYVDMKLAEFNGEDLDTMTRLYKKEFAPNERIDENGTMYHEVVDQHTEFFGEDSKYNSYFTVGDLVLYWAYKLNWDLGDDNYNIVYFTKLILDRSGLQEAIMNDSPSHFQDLVEKIQDNNLYNISRLHVEDNSDIEVTLFGIFQVDEEELRNDLPSSLSQKPMSNISMLRQFWTAETQLMSDLESEKGEGYEDYSDENLDD